MEQGRYFATEDGKIGFEDAPDDFVRKRIVTVNRPISEGNDPPGVADAGGEGGLQAQQLARGLADNFKLPLNAGAEQRVCVVIRKGLAMRKLNKQVAGLLDIKKGTCGFQGAA
jgi:hypothetical protein